MSGGYGSGGYPGQGYGAPDYEEHPARGGRRRQDGSGWRDDQGYEDQAYPDYSDQSYGDQAYGDQGYGQRGHDPRGYGQPGGGTGPAYPPQGPPTGGQYYPNSGPQPGGETGPRRVAGGNDQRGYDPRAEGSYGRGGRGRYEDWDQDQEDGSFLPGFGGRDEFDNGRPGSRAPQRDGRYDYDDGRGPRGPRGGRPGGPAGQGSGDWGSGQGPGGPGGPGSGGPGLRSRDEGRDDRRRDHSDRDDWDSRDNRPRRKATRWAPRILVLVILGVIVIGGGVGGLYVYHKYEARYHPADYAGPGTGDVTVQVMSGDTAFSLAPRLVSLGVIASDRAFTNAAEGTASTTGTGNPGLEAGYYLLHHHMSASLAYAALLNPKNRVQTTVTIPEGKRAVDVIAIVAKQTKIPLKDFQQVLAHPAQLGLPSYANGKVEGYLFPATYAIGPHETALQILQAMVQRFNVEAQALNIVSAAQSVGLTPTQLIIEASLAQAEGGSVNDYPRIAEVISNRLKIGMHLQFDSTVLYGLGKYAVSATIKQTKTPGPYNTYLNAGLPVGPISNPGDAAIQGVLHPAHGNDLYFLTVPGGKSQFSPTPLKGQ